MRSLHCRRDLRTRFLLGLSVAAAVIAAGSLRAADASASGTTPLLKQYCFQCHGEAATMAGINLKELTAHASVGESFRKWQKVIAVLEDGRMPPVNLPEPSAAERQKAATSIRAELNSFVQKHAGDPGRVLPARLRC